jgi:thousand and one amino acid protein kinase
MDEHKQRLDREFENLLISQTREMDALNHRHAKERERYSKNAVALESRRRRQIQQQQESDMKQFLAQQKKDYTRMKEDVRKVNKLNLNHVMCFE